MFDDDMYTDDGHNTLTLEWSSRYEDQNNYIRRVKNVGETYTDILEEFVWFLKSIGFTYIDGLVALNEQGEELKTVHFG